MSKKIIAIILITLIIFVTDHAFLKKISNDIYINSNVLSRRKRFIVFPEGSSFQLVFCNTFPLISSLGSIVNWGYTAALAFELPKDPQSPFTHLKDPSQRRSDTKTIYYIDDDGKVLYKRPYQKKFIVNPAFAKRSIDNTESAKTRQFKKGTREKFKIDRKQMHGSRNKREFLKSEHMDEQSVEFHRSSRSAFYQKIETMLQGLGADGRQCLLKTLCLVGQSQHHPQGSFLQEILRAVFTLPKSDDTDEYYKEYDEAMTTKESCDAQYPDCDQPISDPSSPTFTY